MSRSIVDPGFDAIPQSIAQRLAELTRRARRVSAAKGVAWTLFALLAGSTLAIAADVVVPILLPASAMLFTPGFRLAMLLGVVLIALTTALFTLVLPLRRRWSLTAAALTLERDHPELQERISTTVELMLSRDPDVFRGSEAMIGQVAAAAGEDSVRLDPRRSVAARPARRAWLALAIVALALAGIAAAWPRGFSLYVQRFAAPWNETAQFRRTSVESITGDCSAPRMEQLVIEARSTGLRAERAYLYRTGPDGRQLAPMSANAVEVDGQVRFRFIIEHVEDGFRYRIRANDGVTRFFRVAVVDRPQVERIDLHYRYPAYTGRGDRDELNALGTVQTLHHTQVTVAAETNRDLDTDASFLVLAVNRPATTQGDAPAGEVRLPLSPVGPRRYQASFEATAPGRYHFELSADGLGNLLTPDREHDIIVEADQRPTLTLLRPIGEVRVRGNDTLTLDFDAADDFGLAHARLRYRIDSGSWQQIDLPLPEAGARELHTGVPVELARLGELAAASKIEYQLQVGDNRPDPYGGPQWAASPTQNIVLDNRVADYEERLTETLRETFADSVRRLTEQLKAALAEIDAVQQAMVKQPRLDENQVNRTTSAGEHLDQAHQIAQAAVAASRVSNYERLGLRLGQIDALHIQPAGQLTRQSGREALADQPAARKDHLARSRWHIERALEKLSTIGQEFTDLIKLEAQAEKLAEMAVKQEQIAEQVDAERIDDPKELAKLTAEQNELLTKARELLREQPAESAEPLYDIAARAEKTINQMIGEAAEEQARLAEQTADAERIASLEKQAQQLAGRQAELAATTERNRQANRPALDAAGAKAAPEKAMAVAAEQIRKSDFAAAEQAQKQAGEQLAEIQKKTADDAKATLDKPANDYRQIGQDKQRAETMAQLAKQAADLKKHQEQIAQQTPAAQSAARDAAAKAAAAQRQSEKQSGELAARQKQIAEQSARLQQQAKEKLAPADAATARKNDSTPAAQQAADHLNRQRPDSAESPAKKSEQQARQLADAMAQSAAAHQKAADEAANKAAATSQPDAKAAAQKQAAEQKAQADAARQTAEQARQLADAQAKLNKQIAEQAKPAAQAAADARRQADQAQRQRDDLAKKQQQLADEAKKLQDRLASDPQAKKVTEAVDPATPAAAAAEKMNDPADKGKADPSADQKKAAEQLGQMAQKLDAAARQAADQVAQRQAEVAQAKAEQNASRAAENLKARQDQLTQETRKLGEQLAQARKALMEKQLADVAEKQKQLAERAAELADEIAKPAEPNSAEPGQPSQPGQPGQPSQPGQPGQPAEAKPNPAATRAAAAAAEAARELEKPSLPEAARQQHAAGEQLDKLAGELAEQALDQAGLDPKARQVTAAQAEQAARLARQQRQLAEQVANLQKQDPLANLPVRQEAVREQTEQVGELAKLVGDFMKDLSPEAGKLAEQAAAQLQQADNLQNKAEAGMRAGQLAAARNQQQAAAATVKKAGESFDQAAQAAAEAADQLPQADQAQAQADSPESGEPGQQGEPGEASASLDEPNPFDPLTQAAWAQAQAQQALKNAFEAQRAKDSPAQSLAQAQAAASARQAGQQLSKAASQMARQVTSMAAAARSQPGQAGEQIKLFAPAWTSETGTQGGESDLRRLNFDLGITQAEWNRLPGYIQQEVLQASGEKVPEEYRELIRRYFQTISQQTGQGQAGPK